MESLQLAKEEGIPVIAFAGPVGAGKGTYGEIVSELFRSLNPRIITTSRVIKRCSTEDSDIGEMIRRDIAARKAREGIITSNLSDVPVMKMMDREIRNSLECGFRLICTDGFPRTEMQGAEVRCHSWVQIISFLAEIEDSLARAEKRRKDCEEKGIEPRDDDNPNEVRRRFKNHIRDTMPMLKAYRRCARHMIHDIQAGIHVSMRDKVIRSLRRLEATPNYGLRPKFIAGLLRRMHDTSDPVSISCAKIDAPSVNKKALFEIPRDTGRRNVYSRRSPASLALA